MKGSFVRYTSAEHGPDAFLFACTRVQVKVKGCVTSWNVGMIVMRQRSTVLWSNWMVIAVWGFTHIDPLAHTLSHTLSHTHTHSQKHTLTPTARNTHSHPHTLTHTDKHDTLFYKNKFRLRLSVLNMLLIWASMFWILFLDDETRCSWILPCAIISDAGIVFSLFLISGDFEPRCSFL